MKLEVSTVAVERLTEDIYGGFFGYFDKSPWNPDPLRNQILLHRTDLFDQMPDAGVPIELGVLDIDAGEFRPICQSTAWNFQQGAMLQWRPGSNEEVLFNDMRGTDPIARKVNIASGESTDLPRAIAAVSPTGREALSFSFARLTDIKPEYGYAGAKDPFASDYCPAEDGLWRMNLDTHQNELLISIRQVAECEPEEGMSTCVHYLNHALYNRDGSGFCFLHRYINPTGTQRTRLLVADRDGSNLRVGISGLASHFGWRNTHELLAWAGERKLLGGTHKGLMARLPIGNLLRRLYRVLGKPAVLKANLLNDRYILFDFANGQTTTIGRNVLTTDGHCSFRHDGDWFVTDTYPDKNGRAKLVIASVSRDTAYVVHEFQFPPELDNEVRCDLHPRWHPSKPLIAVDFVAKGKRHIAQLDVSQVVS